jgi:hypothetical protein
MDQNAEYFVGWGTLSLIYAGLEQSKGRSGLLAVHSIHRQEIVLGMDAADLDELAQWLGSQR